MLSSKENFSRFFSKCSMHDCVQKAVIRVGMRTSVDTLRKTVIAVAFEHLEQKIKTLFSDRRFVKQLLLLTKEAHEKGFYPPISQCILSKLRKQLCIKRYGFAYDCRTHQDVPSRNMFSFGFQDSFLP